MGFKLLPAETILTIASYLPPSSLPSFAQVNSRTYQTLHELSRPVLKYRHNCSAIINRFGEPSYQSGCVVNPINYITDNPLLEDRYDEPDREDGLADLEYLRLNGDLHWLRPLPDDIQETNVWGTGKAATTTRVARLVQQAKDMDVEFPPGFINFISSQKLIDRMYLGGDYFFLGPELVKCEAYDDKGAGGYVVRFLCDQQWCGFWALYMAPGGEHCVLALGTDVHCEKCLDRDEYIERARVRDQNGETHDELSITRQEEINDFLGHPRPQMYGGVTFACDPLESGLTHPNFEEWLCMRYFDGWVSASVEMNPELDPRQEKYLDNHWPKKATTESEES